MYTYECMLFRYRGRMLIALSVVFCISGMNFTMCETIQSTGNKRHSSLTREYLTLFRGSLDASTITSAIMVVVKGTATTATESKAKGKRVSKRDKRHMGKPVSWSR